MPKTRFHVRSFALILAAAGMLAGCAPAPDTGPSGLPATTEPATATPPDTPSVTTAATASFAPSATSIPTQSAANNDNLIVYYRFATSSPPFPRGSVVVASDAYILAPIQLEIARTPDTAADLAHALNAVIADSQNLWVSSKLQIVDITFDAGHADVVLQGERYGVGDVTLIAARMQILMTIFANAAVNSTTATHNGDTIGNWGVSNSMNAKPADYVFTRAEIESFMAENAYKAP
jgi:hypothetical protein